MTPPTRYILKGGGIDCPVGNRLYLPAFRILHLRATKVSEIGQQALVGAEGAEASQGRKDHGILATYESMATKPWLQKHGWADGMRDLGQQDPWIFH